MTETKKQRMDPERFIEIFKRYPFEDKGMIIERLKHEYRLHGELVKEELHNSLQALELKISEVENKIS